MIILWVVFMLKILGVEYLTDKEASMRYGYSQSWFVNARVQKKGPPFIKIKGAGRVLYPLRENDQWFMDRLQREE